MTWFKQLFTRRRRYDELHESIREHLEEKIEDLMEDGMSREKAEQTARRQFGNVKLIEERSREVWQPPAWESYWANIKFAVRQLLRNPGFTVTVIFTLALSIGANTAIFSIVNALMLKSLPYPHPERMGTMYTRVTGVSSWDARHKLTYEQWQLLRDEVPALLSAVSGSRTSGVNLEAGSHAQYLQSGRISAHYLDVLGIRLALGLNFSDVEDRAHGPNAAILSYPLWRNTFASDPNILGQTVLLKGAPYTVMGVLPEGAITPLNADIYTALQLGPEGEGSGTNVEAITRLRDGATWQEADSEINRAWSHRAHRYELNDDPNAQVTYHSVPLQTGLTASLRPQALALMLATGFILLIASANLAGLTLVRVLRRSPEFATRLALGASRWQIQKQLWVENLLLAFLGGTAGVAVGFVSLRGLLQLLPEHYLPVAKVSLDSRVLAFTLLICLLTSVLFGMFPALAMRKFRLRSAFASHSATGGDPLRLRQALIVGEVALTVLLLAASGLLIRTLVHLQTLPAGFDATGVITAKASLDDVRYQDAVAFRKLLSESTSAMRQIPGVQSVAVGISLPYERAMLIPVTTSDGKDAGQQGMTDQVYITPDYFQALQIPLLAGRSFSDADGPDTQHVAIVNQTFARKYFHGTDAVGHYVNKDTRIVGVVEDVPIAPGIDATAPLTGEETMYIPAAQTSQLAVVHVFFQPSWIVRTAGPVEGLTAQMQHALASADPDLPFSGFFNMRDLMAKALATQRIEVALLSAMAALALLLSTIGIFALVANLVAQKTREIGIRIALGSTVRQAMVHIGAPGVWASTIGLILGLVLCAGALHAMRSVLYGVSVYDVPTILIVVLTLEAVTLVATTAPALRIAGIDPAKTLRDE
jgi:predicted permease